LPDGPPAAELAAPPDGERVDGVPLIEPAVDAPGKAERLVLAPDESFLWPPEHAVAAASTARAIE
jgi:hypothetical protein